MSELIKVNFIPLIGGELRIQNVEDEDRIFYAHIKGFEFNEPSSLVIKLSWCARCQGSLIEGKKINLIAEKLIAVELREYILTFPRQESIPKFNQGDKFLIIYHFQTNEQLYFKPLGDENYEYVDVNRIENLEFSLKKK